MLKDVFKNMKSAASDYNPVDPARFADPVATMASWKPAKSGSANFSTHRLVRLDEKTLEYRPTVVARAFGPVFCVAGIGIAALFWVLPQASPVVIPVGLAFFLVGGLIFLQATSPIRFDQVQGLFLKGRSRAGDAGRPGEMKNACRLSDIHALQLLRKIGRTPGDEHQASREFYAYELNLILQDSRRIHVMNYVDERKFREDVQLISRMLDVPVWDTVFG